MIGNTCRAVATRLNNILMPRGGRPRIILEEQRDMIIKKVISTPAVLRIALQAEICLDASKRSI
jgi:hypothetical protein